MFSIIVPCFNELASLKKMLRSFTWQQAAVPFEIILIDNNSHLEDLNAAYLDYFNQLPLYLIKQPQLASTFSPSRARNLGLKLARYDWIITLDSDIILNPNYLQSLQQIVAQKNNPFLIGERIFVDANHYDDQQFSAEHLSELQPVNSRSNYFLPQDRRLQFMDQLAQSPHPWAYMHSGNSVFNKQEAERIAGYDEEFDGHWGYEDIDFAHRLIVHTQAQPIFAPELFVYHQERSVEAPHDQDRFNKDKNPNWQRICEKIPGFFDFKKSEYQQISSKIIL